MRHCEEQKLKIACPSCGHEQITVLEWSVFSDELASANCVLNGVDTTAINGGFECICGKKVTAVLLVTGKSKK